MARSWLKSVTDDSTYYVFHNFSLDLQSEKELVTSVFIRMSLQFRLPQYSKRVEDVCSDRIQRAVQYHVLHEACLDKMDTEPATHLQILQGQSWVHRATRKQRFLNRTAIGMRLGIQHSTGRSNLSVEHISQRDCRRIAFLPTYEGLPSRHPFSKIRRFSLSLSLSRAPARGRGAP